MHQLIENFIYYLLILEINEKSIKQNNCNLINFQYNNSHKNCVNSI